MKMAIVSEDLVQKGGAEEVLFQISKDLDCTIFTPAISNYWKIKYQELGVEIKTSKFLSILCALGLAKFCGVFGLFTFFFESLNLDKYDLVLSFSSRYAHNIITKPNTKHICYMYSPPRMYWEPHRYFNKYLLKLLSPILSAHRVYDFTSAKRVDYFITQSEYIKGKIKKYYGLDSYIISPFSVMENEQSVNEHKDYYVVLGRLVSWKKFDLAITACFELGRKLLVVGDGPCKKKLQALAKNLDYKNIEFLGYVSQDEKKEIYANCKALIHPQEEDFGLTMVEAQRFGKGVIAYGVGGASGVVLDKKSGVLFWNQSSKDLADAILEFEKISIIPSVCIENSYKYTKKIFIQSLKNFIDNVYL